MKSILKGLIAIMLVLSMVFAFAACTDKKSEGSNGGGGEDIPGTNLNPGSPEDEEDEPANMGNPDENDDNLGGGNSDTGDNDVNIGESFN